MNIKPGCKTCGGTGRCIEHGNWYESRCPECWKWNEELAEAYSRRAYLATAFSEAVMWIRVFNWAKDDDTWGLYINRVYFESNVRQSGELVLGIDGTGNLVELIDHEGNVFSMTEWLNQ